MCYHWDRGDKRLGNIFGSNLSRTAVLLAATIFFQACLVAPPVSAKIYQWKDANGNISYGDSPPSGVKALEKHIKANKIVMPEIKEPPQEERQISTRSRLRPISDISVILYATDWCPYCKKTRAYLQSKGIRFTEYDIDKDPGKRKEMIEKSGTNGVPVLDIEGIIIRGFDPREISAAIEARRKVNN